MSDLPSYRMDRSCPKCKATMGTTWHHAAQFGEKEWPCAFQRPGFPEHLCRICHRCGYGLIEATADASENKSGLRSLPGGAG